MTRPVVHSVVRSVLGTSSSSWKSYWDSLVSAVVENVEPTKVVITFIAAKKPLITDFVITDHIIDAMSIVGKVVTLTLSTPVIYYDILTVTFKAFSPVSITNNVLDDGKSVAWFDPEAAGAKVVIGGKDAIYWDLLTGSAGRGAEESSGVTVAFGVYEITATEANHFYTGCAVGDIMPLVAGKTLDANNKVKRVLGNHLGQPDAAKRMVAGETGYAAYMKTAAFTLNQPVFIYGVMKLNAWAVNKILFDGNTYPTATLICAGTTPELRISAGSQVAKNTNMTLGEWKVVRVLFDGANSFLQIMNTNKTTGNADAGNAGGWTLGAKADGSLISDLSFKEAILRNNSDSAEYQASLYNHLITKWRTLGFISIIVLNFATVLNFDSIL